MNLPSWLRPWHVYLVSTVIGVEAVIFLMAVAGLLPTK